MALPASSPVPALTAANQTEDGVEVEVHCTVETPPPPVKKPMERLIHAVRDSSPGALSSSVDSIRSAQTAANQTEDEVEVRCAVETPPPPAKKPMERLIDAVRNISPEGLRIAVNSMKLALATMDSVPDSSPEALSSSVDSIRSTLVTMHSVPLPPSSGPSNNNKMRRVFDVTSSYSESPPAGCLDVPGAAAYDGEHGANKRQKTQNAKEVLLDEIEDINSQLIDTTVSIIGDYPADGITSCNRGTLIKLSYTGVSLASNLKSHPIISVMRPLVMPVVLLVAADYPASSPTIICDQGDEQIRKNSSSISVEVDAAFRRALRVLREPWSLKETASAWDACVRRVLTDFAKQHGGGTLGSRLGQWESGIGE